MKVGRAERKVAEILRRRIEKNTMRPDFARKHPYQGYQAGKPRLAYPSLKISHSKLFDASRRGSPPHIPFEELPVPKLDGLILLLVDGSGDP